MLWLALSICIIRFLFLDFFEFLLNKIKIMFIFTKKKKKFFIFHEATEKNKHSYSYKTRWYIHFCWCKQTLVCQYLLFIIFLHIFFLFCLKEPQNGTQLELEIVKKMKYKNQQQHIKLYFPENQSSDSQILSNKQEKIYEVKQNIHINESQTTKKKS